jgi:hypothetical protein
VADDSRRRRDGAGKSDKSYRKHELVGSLARAQAAVLRLSRREGVIIDMHAGDGVGVATEQEHLFGENESMASARLALGLGEKCLADVVLCETKADRREQLRPLMDAWPHTRLLRSNRELASKVDYGPYRWALVLNDPNGHSKHSVEAMQAIAASVPVSDFIVCLNEGSLKRHLGVEDDGDGLGDNARLVRSVRESKERYAWMLEHKNWASLLGKRTLVKSRICPGSAAFRCRVMLLTNFAAKHPTRLFETIQVPPVRFFASSPSASFGPIQTIPDLSPVET